MIRLCFWTEKEWGFKNLFFVLNRYGTTPSERRAIFDFLYKKNYSAKNWIVQRDKGRNSPIEILLDGEKYTVGKRGKIVRVKNEK